MREEGKYEEQHSLKFTKVTWYERLWKFASFLPKQIPLFAMVTASFWGVAEVLAEIDGESLSLKQLSAPALITALFVSIYRAFQGYISYVPDALASESSVARDLYRKGQSGWQYALAKEMLSRRIAELDRTLDRVEKGSQYAKPVKMDGPEYLTWLQSRPEILLRLVHATSVQCISELPSVIGDIKREEDLSDLRSSVDQLASLYEEAVMFELNVRSVIPPSELRDTHQMIFGWSAPIRNGVTRFTEILDAISRLDVKRVSAATNEVPNFGIEFHPPSNLNKFSEAIRSIDSSVFR